MEKMESIIQRRTAKTIRSFQSSFPRLSRSYKRGRIVCKTNGNDKRSRTISEKEKLNEEKKRELEMYLNQLQEIKFEKGASQNTLESDNGLDELDHKYIEKKNVLNQLEDEVANSFPISLILRLRD